MFFFVSTSTRSIKKLSLTEVKLIESHAKKLFPHFFHDMNPLREVNSINGPKLPKYFCRCHIKEITQIRILLFLPELNLRKRRIQFNNFLPRKEDRIGRFSKRIEVNQLDSVLTESNHIENVVWQSEPRFQMLAVKRDDVAKDGAAIGPNVRVELSLKPIHFICFEWHN